MAKRFTDTEKWKKPFVKGLDHAHKLLWFYLLDDCNHAGIWQADWEVVEIRIGKFDPAATAEIFKEHIQVFDDGKKWFIKDFIEFQYGELEPRNSMFKPVMAQLTRYGLVLNTQGIPPVNPPLWGGKEKVQVKVMVKEKDKELDSKVQACYDAYPSYRKGTTSSTGKGSKDKATIRRILEKGGYDLMAAIAHEVNTAFNGSYRNLSTFLNNLPDPASMAPPPKPPGPAKKPAHVHHFIEQEGKTICALCGVEQPPEPPT